MASDLLFGLPVMIRTAFLCCLVALALPAQAAGSLEALRAQSRGGREQVAQLKSQQLALRNELSTLSSRIEQLKASSKGKLLPGGELDASLKKSQELSSTLTGLAQQVSSRESELEAAQLALESGLTQELSRLRAEFDRQSDRSVRAGIIEQMKRLRAERETVRAAIPPARLPSLEALKPSDDPEVLLEQADLLRDNQEKLERELKTLEGRIAERRQEVELDRRVQRFMGEDSMFDDQDRRLRVQRTDSATAFAGSATAGTKDSATPTPTNSADLPGPVLGGAAGSPEPVVRSGSDAHPQLGGTPSALAGDDDDLRGLEATRTKLKGLAEQMKQKASELEGRAAQLR